MCGAHSTWNRNAVVDEIATAPRATTDEHAESSTDKHDRKRRSAYVSGHNTCAMVCMFIVVVQIAFYLHTASCCRLPLLLRPKLRPVVILSDRRSHAQLVPGMQGYVLV